MRIVSVDPRSDPLWRDLAMHPLATVFHSPPWIAALCDCYDFEPQALVVVDPANVVIGGVAFCEIDDVFGARLVSLPFSDACDPLLADAAAWPLLRERLAEFRLPISMRLLDTSFLRGDPEFAIVKQARWHTLDISPPLDAIRDGFSSATRRGIAKAERAGISVRPLAGEASIASFVRLHMRLRKRKYRLLAQPLRFFLAIAEQFEPIGGWHSLGAWHGNTLLAATIYLRWGDTLFYKFNASAQDGSLTLRPNNILAWAGIALAKELGLKAFDFGPSDDDQPGLIRFKRGFGATERELRSVRWLPRGAKVEERPEIRSVLAEMADLFTAPAVSDEVTEAAGATLYRLFA
jgi:CelD/BcsL family acetyltransferase involved in cellulose biosynthesis